jgi:hypothetical protein
VPQQAAPLKHISSPPAPTHNPPFPAPAPTTTTHTHKPHHPPSRPAHTCALQAAALKHLTRLQLCGVWSPAKDLSRNPLRSLRVLDLTFRGTPHKAHPGTKLDLSK